MYCLVNKLFKDDLYLQKKKRLKRENIQSLKTWLFSALGKTSLKMESSHKLASFYMQEKNMYVSFACSHSIVMVAAFAIKRSLLMITNFFYKGNAVKFAIAL